MSMGLGVVFAVEVLVLRVGQERRCDSLRNVAW
jgi:hypothetical protein